MPERMANPSANIRTSRRNIIGRDQIEMIISYMEEHSLFARGQIAKLGPQGNIKFKSMWLELTQKLNSLGPCVLDASKWQEKWKNMRLQAKQRTAIYMHQYNKTGHCIPDLELNENNKRISDIFGKYGVGLEVTTECGFERNHSRKSEGSVNCSIVVDVNVAKKLEYDVGNCTQSNWSNDSMKKSCKVTDDQKEILLQFMQTHPRFANDLSDASLWEELMLLLNAFEPVKTYQAWKRTWLDSVKAARQARALFDAGLRSESLSDYHTQILELMDSIETDDFPDNENSEAEDVDMQCKTFKRPSSVPYVQEQKKVKSSTAISNITAAINSCSGPNNFIMQQNAMSPRVPLRAITTPQPTQIILPRVRSSATSTASTSQNRCQSIVTSMSTQQNVRLPAYAPIATPIGVSQRIKSSPTSAQGQGRCLLQLRSPSLRSPSRGSSTSTSAAVVEAGKEKASAFMNAFQQSQKGLLNQIESSFEKQSKIQKESQQELMTSLPAIIEQSVRKVLQEFIEPTSRNKDHLDVPQEPDAYIENAQAALTENAQAALIETTENIEIPQTFIMEGQQYTLLDPQMITQEFIAANVNVYEEETNQGKTTDDQVVIQQD